MGNFPEAIETSATFSVVPATFNLIGASESNLFALRSLTACIAAGSRKRFIDIVVDTMLPDIRSATLELLESGTEALSVMFVSMAESAVISHTTLVVIRFVKVFLPPEADVLELRNCFAKKRRILDMVDNEEEIVDRILTAMTSESDIDMNGKESGKER